MLPEKGYKRIMVICFYIVLGLAACYGFFNYLLKWLWPIFTALIVGIILQPVVRFLKKKLKFPGKLASVLSVLLLYAVVGYLIFTVIYKSVAELSALAAGIPNYILKLNIDMGNIESYAKSVLSKIPFLSSSEVLDNVWSNISNSLISALQSFSEKLITSLTPFLTSVVQFIPSLLLAVVIMIVSTVYFTSDYDKIKGFFALQIPKQRIERLRSLKEHFVYTVIRYLRAYLLLMLITCAELYLGFTVLGQSYALILAIAISIIDVLPVLGTGTVLIPWGVILIVTGSTAKGIEILALYVFVMVIRQILEPKIVGNYIGLYPLITLIAMYCGLQSLGLFGMFLFPITIIILKELNQNGSVNLWKNPPDAEESISNSAKIAKKIIEKKHIKDERRKESKESKESKENPKDKKDKKISDKEG